MKESARIVVEDCLGVKESETVLVIVDEKTYAIGAALFDTAKDLGAEVMLLKMIERKSHGIEPPRLVAEAMKNADVVIAPTSKSLSHTKARLEANKNGARIASMPTITEDIMCRTMSADYIAIKRRSEKFADILSQGKEVILTTPAGTNLTLYLEGRQGHADTGDIREKGSMSNLPAGEAYIAPVEGKTAGIFVVDGSMAGIGVVKMPIKMLVKEGYVTDVSGGSEAVELSATLEGQVREARNIAELGIGTNEKAIPSGNPLEDEKVMGTVHIAIGNNSTFGGSVQVPLHLDGIMKRPTLIVNGKTVIKDGKHLI
jgi:leucyl aminopeptidase (aminopeptidase T)